MTVKDLRKKLLKFPKDMEACIDFHPHSPEHENLYVGYGDDKKQVWITNYE